MTSTAAKQTDPEALSSRVIRQLRSGVGPLLAALIVICVVLSIASPEFLTTSTLTNILVQTSVVGIAAVGGTFVIITSGIDLSVGSLVALSGMVAATFMAGSTPDAVGVGIAGLAIALAVGALVSVLVDIPRAAGASALGGLAAGSIVLPAIILAVAGAVVGLFLTIVTGRFELGAKREQIGVLNAMGWNPDMLRQVRFFEHALVGLYALPIGVLGAALLGIFLAPYAAVWAGIAGLLAVVVWVPVATRIIR